MDLSWIIAGAERGEEDFECNEPPQEDVTRERARRTVQGAPKDYWTRKVNGLCVACGAKLPSGHAFVRCNHCYKLQELERISRRKRAAK